MPSKPKRPCNHPGCSELVQSGYCDKHKKVKQQVQYQRRGSAASRGYGSRWQKYRLQFLQAHPLCVKCERTTAATDVDHIIPVTGPNDPLFWDPKNHQPLCHSHHSEKTAKEDGGFGNK